MNKIWRCFHLGELTVPAHGKKPRRVHYSLFPPSAVPGLAAPAAPWALVRNAEAPTQDQGTDCSVRDPQVPGVHFQGGDG